MESPMSKQPMTPTTFRLGDADRKRLEILRKRMEDAWRAAGFKRSVSKGDALRNAITFTEQETRP